MTTSNNGGGPCPADSTLPLCRVQTVTDENCIKNSRNNMACAGRFRNNTVAAVVVAAWLLNIPATCSVCIRDIYVDSCTCYHAGLEVPLQTFTRPQQTDTGPTSFNTDPVVAGVWQGGRFWYPALGHWYDWTGGSGEGTPISLS